MMNKVAAAFVAGGILAISTAALARPSHCPPGHAKKGWCSPGGSQARDFERYGDRNSRRGVRADYDDYRSGSRYEDRRWRY